MALSQYTIPAQEPARKKKARVKRVCQTCAFEPRWEKGLYSVGIPFCRGVCRFPIDKKAVKHLCLPHGSTISTPMVDFDTPKQNCPAWKDKGGAD